MAWLPYRGLIRIHQRPYRETEVHLQIRHQELLASLARPLRPQAFNLIESPHTDTLNHRRFLILIHRIQPRTRSSTLHHQATLLMRNIHSPTLSPRVKRKVSCHTPVPRWRPKIPLSNLVLPPVNTQCQCRNPVGRGGMFRPAEDPHVHSQLVSRPATSIKGRSRCRLTTNLNELNRRTSRSLRSHHQPLLQIRRSSLPSLPPPPEGIQVAVLLHPGVQVNQEEAQLGEE